MVDAKSYSSGCIVYSCTAGFNPVGSACVSKGWTAVLAENQTWYDIASSSDGRKLAAVVYGGNIWISSDYGSTWKEVIADALWEGGKGGSIGPPWQSITSSSDGVKLAAVSWNGELGESGGYEGKIWISSDSGETWNTTGIGLSHAEQPDEGEHWLDIASSSDGEKLVAVGRMHGYTLAWSSNSGETWDDQSGGAAPGAKESDWDGSKASFRAVTSSANGTRLAILQTSAKGGTPAVWTYGQNGPWDLGGGIEKWSKKTPGEGAWYQAITSSSNGKRLAVIEWKASEGSSGDCPDGSSTEFCTNGTILTSSDYGETFTSGSQGAWTAPEWYDITSNSEGDKLAAVARRNFGGSNIWTSSDYGVTWTRDDSDSFQGNMTTWRSIASSSSGDRLAAVDEGGYIWTLARRVD